MRQVSRTPSLIRAPSLRAYFHRVLQEAAQTQRISTDLGILAYLTHLLTDYARSERVFDHTPNGMVRRPLVDLYRQASDAQSNGERELGQYGVATQQASAIH
jgi:hypothetical protein